MEYRAEVKKWDINAQGGGTPIIPVTILHHVSRGLPALMMCVTHMSVMDNWLSIVLIIVVHRRELISINVWIVRLAPVLVTKVGRHAGGRGVRQQLRKSVVGHVQMFTDV